MLAVIAIVGLCASWVYDSPLSYIFAYYLFGIIIVLYDHSKNSGSNNCTAPDKLDETMHCNEDKNKYNTNPAEPDETTECDDSNKKDV